MQKIANLKSLKSLLQKNPKVICDFYADWCGPCKMIAPRFEELSKDQRFNKIVFAKIDVDEAEDIASEFKIQSIPTFIAFHNSEVVDKFQSSDSRALESTLEQLIQDKN